MGDPLEEPLPALSDKEAGALLEERYGLSGTLAALHGERDLNYRVETAGGRRYLLKVHNPADDPAVIAMRTGAIDHVRRVDPGLPVPEVIPTSSGEEATAFTAADGRVSIVQLLSFLPGRHASRDELEAGHLFAWGAATARLGRALRGYFHPAADYVIQWDLRRTPELRDRLGLLPEDQAVLAKEVIDRFCSKVAPVLPSLRAQVVHNDMSRQNILVDDSMGIVGITDFGDMTFAPLVCDLAIAVADVLDGRPDSLELAAPMVAGYCSVVPLEQEEAALLGDLVAARLATALVVSTWRLREHPSAPEFPEGALQFLRILSAAGLDEVGERLGRLAGEKTAPPPAGGRPTAELQAARRRVLGPLSTSYDEPLHLVRGEGVNLYDAEGRRYLDAYNNVPVAGHCHPAVAEAIARQARELVTNTRYLQEASVELAEKLLARAPAGLDRVMFVNSGSEANDITWRMARFATGNDGAFVTRHAYHGVTEATNALSPEEWPAGFAPPNVGLLQPPDGTGRVSGHREVIERLGAAGHGAAALFIDTALTSDGILGPATDWLRQAVEEVRTAGGLFVADEVQAGYGRTGEGLWSIEATGIEPDFMTLGKPMGNGFPVAAALGRSSVVDPFMEETGYFSTFGGNTLACAAALAVLRVVEQEGLVERAALSGRRLRSLLDEVAGRHPAVGAVRGWGLLVGVELVGQSGIPDPVLAARVVNEMRRLGVLVGATGPGENVLKIRPPLVFSESDADEVAGRLDAALESCRAL